MSDNETQKAPRKERAKPTSAQPEVKSEPSHISTDRVVVVRS